MNTRYMHEGRGADAPPETSVERFCAALAAEEQDYSCRLDHDGAVRFRPAGHEKPKAYTVAEMCERLGVAL